MLARLIEPISKADTVRVLEEIGARPPRCARFFVSWPGRRNGTTGLLSSRHALLTPPHRGMCPCVSTMSGPCIFQAEDEDTLGKVG